MSDYVMLWLTIAVGLFWAMGAYNRLVRLRSQSIGAFVALEGVLNQYVVLVKTNYTEVGQISAAGDPRQGIDVYVAAWVALEAAADQFNASLKVAHLQPLNGPTLRALRTALDTLHLSWLRLRDLPLDVSDAAIPGSLQSHWEHIAFQSEIARTEFNRRVLSYNDAIHQFPALLLAWLFGFKTAQPI